MRAFVAIELPDELKAALAHEQSRLRKVCPDARWTKPEGIHLTLKFLGETSAEQMTRVKEVLGRIGPFERFSVQAKGFGFFPDAKRPRVLWAGLEAPPELPHLAKQVETALAEIGFPPENRAFNPHLTLARFRIPRPQPKLQELLATQDALHFGTFDVSEYFLWESRLLPKGAEYRKLARFP